jgi:putative CocE/NonD family hydrolase
MPDVFSLLNAGYAVVWMECRGTFSSEGTFTPKVNESDDGYDSVDWVISQPWSNGRVGAYGASYLGMTQWAIAITGHPALKAVAPTMTSLDWFKGVLVSPWRCHLPVIATGWAVAMQLNQAPSGAAVRRSGQHLRGDRQAGARAREGEHHARHLREALALR